MNAIQQALASFQPQDIFNCDETGLFWKRVPDHSLSTHALPGRCKEKVRIMMHFAVNQDASERLPLWIIGRSATPHAFSATRINIQSLGVYWRHNKSAWMTGAIMEEWLRYMLQEYEAGRDPVTTMDILKAIRWGIRAWDLDLSD